MSAPGEAGAIQPVRQREFIRLIGGAAAAWAAVPFCSARAQNNKGALMRALVMMLRR